MDQYREWQDAANLQLRSGAFAAYPYLELVAAVSYFLSEIREVILTEICNEILLLYQTNFLVNSVYVLYFCKWKLRTVANGESRS